MKERGRKKQIKKETNKEEINRSRRKKQQSSLNQATRKLSSRSSYPLPSW